MTEKGPHVGPFFVLFGRLVGRTQPAVFERPYLLIFLPWIEAQKALCRELDCRRERARLRAGARARGAHCSREPGWVLDPKFC